MDVQALRAKLVPLSDAERAAPMAAYMKHHFAFLGIAAQPRRKAARAWIRSFKGASSVDLLDAADACWMQPEREFQYVGADLLRRWSGALEAEHLPRVRSLITQKSWWDTVDVLAVHAVGPMVKRHGLGAVMDAWAVDQNLWVSRTAILHQLAYKSDTDAERLFRHCAQQASHPDFFIRKAIGWALREQYRQDPAAVVAFTESHALSGLSKREALKHHQAS